MHVRLACLVAVFSVVALAAQTGSQETKLPIAVKDLVSQGVEASSASIISDRMRNELVGTGTFVVLERGQMEEILKEQGFQQSGCTTDACAVEIGQLLGVKFLVVGSIGKLGQTFTINARMIDVATGKIVLSANADCRCEIDDVLSKSTVEIANRLVAAVRGEPNPRGALQERARTPAPSVKVQVAPTPTPEDSARKKRLSPVVKIGFACIGVAGGLGGVLMDSMVKEDLRECETIQQEASAPNSSADIQELEARFNSAKNSASSKAIVRDILYGVGGLGGVGFGITIWF